MKKEKIITLVGAVFTVYGLILCIMANINAGSLLVAVFGIVTLGIGVFYSKILRFLNTRLFRICKILVILCLCAEIILISFIAIYGVSDNVDYNENAVIVLGAAIRGDRVTFPLKMRLDKTIEYHHENPDALIIVTGGQGVQESVTEAYAMEKYLVENGIDRDKIIKEEKATSTSENMKFSKEILDNHFGTDYSVAVVTNNFHIFRGFALAKNMGFQNVTHLHAELQWYNLLPCYLRESLAIIKMIIFDF